MYEVVVLIERPLADSDAQALADLYGQTPDRTHVHVLLPSSDAPSQIETMLATLSDGSGVPMPLTPPVSSDDILGAHWSAADHAAALEESRSALDRTLGLLRSRGLDADGEVIPDEPLAALESIVTERDSDEVVVMTRAHVISQFLRVDWGSVARRHLDVPVLHLLEHAED